MADTQVQNDAAASPIEPGRCPLCGGDNGCGAEAARRSGQRAGDCWCMHTPVPASLIATLPQAARGRACICAACVAAHRPGEPESPDT